MNKHVAVIIPTYNEVTNVALLLKSITKLFSEIHIIIVDDSQEEQNKQIQAIVEKLPNVRVISRIKKLGRGSAVLEGFRMALENKQVKYIFEMDSDLAHDPEEMQRFLTKMRSEHNGLVVGSRYKKGGKVIHMPLYRIVISKITNTFLHLLLGVKLTDYTSGFRLYSRDAVDYLTKIPLQTTGFITLSETAYKLHRHHFAISEVPISVYGRSEGKSTVTVGLLFQSLIAILKIRLQTKD